MNIFNLFSDRKEGKKNPLSDSERYKITKSCPNFGPWDELHCIYGIKALSSDEEIFIALPRAPFWNFMAMNSNYKSSFNLPDRSTNFREMELKVLGDVRKVYVHKSLLF